MLFPLFIVLSALSSALRPPPFIDVTSSVGIRQSPQRKYGGPIVADLNSDGVYDLILAYHKSHPHEIYYGTAEGRFEKAEWTTGGDVHGIAVAPRTANASEKIVFMSRGGQGGRTPRVPTVLLASAEGLRDISEEFGFGRPAPRGRIALFMDLKMRTREDKVKNGGGLDMLVNNYLGAEERVGKQYAMENVNGMYKERRVPGFATEPWGRGGLIDVNGDGVLEILSFLEMRMYELIKPFTFERIEKKVLPDVEIEPYTVTGFVEVDFDNDGDYDVYLSRGYDKIATTRHYKPNKLKWKDVLLENREGVLVDVSSKLPDVEDISMGVTACDVNNDGWIDLVVTQLKGPDVVLMNNGGNFKRHELSIPKRKTTGDNSLCVDYDMDGRVDIITGQGMAGDPEVPGEFKVLRNTGSLGKFLLVKVGAARDGSASALHAVVRVDNMMRRVGSNGFQKQGGGSFLDVVHFGVGSKNRVDVSVRWESGAEEKITGVKTNSIVEVGKF